MSIVSSIRDYVELLNTLSDSLGNQLTSTKFISASVVYFLDTIKYSIYYIFSFQWLRDFTLLPINIPQYSQAIFSEHLFLETPKKVFFEFLEIPSINQNKFLLGFFNSFFLTLPITVTHIIAFRRLIIQGVPAAFFSFFGFILGQTLFILCVTFGIRSILIPWLSLEPLNYILGFILIFQIVYSMVGENLTVLKWNNQSHKQFFQKFFITNLILSWCEQSCIFQYFSNLTLTGHSSILEGFSSKTVIASFFCHSNYILGIFLGSILFSLFWIFFIWQIKNIILSFTRISPASFVQTVNRGTFVIVLSFTLSSIPFYGLDYLFAGPLGFISQDYVFKNTFLDQNEIKDPIASGLPSDKKVSLNIDVSPFDRGRYLVFPEESDHYSFEDLNYRSEMDWTRRSEKESSITESKAGFFSIGKIFKKQKDQSVNNLVYQSPESINEAKSNFLLSQEEIMNYKIADSAIPEYRFNGWYNLDSDNVPDLKDENIIDTYRQFNETSFSPDFLRENSVMEINIEKKIKQKYYSNPIYKNLLTLDIDLFLNRQPASWFLGPEHELDLHEKRQLLNSYYDSLRWYTKLPYAENFENFFNGTKSFTNKIYNQQFKGTLRSLRRLFCLTIISPDIISTKSNDFVLKYDQPLYQGKLKFSPYHEEIPEIELFDKKQNNSPNGEKISNPFLKDFISKPLYTGWDDNLRKFVITNKLLPRSVTGYEMNRSPNWDNKFSIEKSNKLKFNAGNSETIYFSVWPKIKNNKLQEKVPFTFLFSNNTPDSEIDKIGEYQVYNTLPSNFEIVQKLSKPDSGFNFVDLAPKRGGFIWSGTIPFDFKNIFK